MDWFLFACRIYFLMNMSSLGTSTTCNNSINVSQSEDVGRSTETLYSDFKPQSEIYDSKKSAKAKFAKNKQAKRKEKLKDARRNNTANIPPKNPPTTVYLKNGVEYVEQSLVEHLYPSSILDQARSTLTSISSKDDLSSHLFEVLEVVGALAISLPNCKTPVQVASQFVLAIRAMTKGSITENVLKQAATIEWCKELFGFDVFQEQAGLPKSATSWLSKIPSLKENWEAVRNAPVFGKMSSLISVAASIGLCSVSGLNWSVGGVDIFRAGTVKKHATAMDFVGAVLDTVICFIEGGFECFRQRSFKPLIFTSDAGRELDDLYFPLIELHEHAMVFNLHAKPVTIEGETRVVSDLEYGQLVEKAIDLATRAFKSAKGTWQQGYLEKRLEVLHRNKAAYQAKRIDGSLRFAPATFYVDGGSGVGKSSIAQILMADCLAVSGANPDFKDTAVLKESDKYDSTLKGDTSGIFFDDLGNTKSEFLDKAPTERIIDINNNMVTYANKADLHEKGKVEVRPRVFIITSNKPLHFHAKTGSIEPFSIVRRADIHITVKVKPEYALIDGRLDSKKANRDFPGDSLIADVWDLYAHVPNEKGNGQLLSPYAGGTECKPVSILELLRICTSHCVEHFDNQRTIIRKGVNHIASRKYCSDCRLGHDLCKCEPVVPELEPESDTSSLELSDTSSDEESVSDSSGIRSEPNLQVPFEKQVSVEETLEFISTQFTNMGTHTNSVLNSIPSMFFDNGYVQKAYLFCYAREFLTFERSVRQMCLGIDFVLFLLFNCLRNQAPLIIQLALFIFSIIVYCSTLAAWRDRKLTVLANRRDSAVEMFASIRNSKTLQFFSVVAIGKLLHSFVCMFRTAIAVQQSALAPESVDEIKARDAEVNPWASAVVAELHVSDRAATSTHEQVCKKVAKNLFHGFFVEDNFQQKCDVLALGGTLYAMPYHAFKNRKNMKAVLTRADPTTLNSTFRAVVSVAHMVPIEGKDLCIVNIASGGVHADITYLFPEKLTASGSGTFIYRNSDGSLREDAVRLRYETNSECGGPGFSYDTPYNTFVGLCMGVAIANYARPCVAALHLRGIPDTPHGKGATLTKSDLEKAIAHAKATWKGALIGHSTGTLPSSRYEQQICATQDVHPNSPVNYLPVGSTVEYLGQTGQRATHTKSRVRKTPISDAVAEETGVENVHGAPKFHRYKMWQASLAHSANPSPGIEGTLLELAYEDYVGGLVDNFLKFDVDWVKSELRPLSEMEALCGKDGKRFIDAIPKGTSPGFGLSGKKRDHITLLDPELFEEFNCPAIARPEVLAEVAKMKKCLLAGERYYSVFKACVKDEPTPLTKDKVRVFQAADWATQLVIRQYFLPLARMLSLFPIVSECAVGVNAQGPEWDQLAKHMRSHGEDRILAGDYSKYDLRMPAQLILAAFQVLIEVAEKCGTYTEDDLTIMRGVATEVAYSCVAYNGDLIIHCGSNPSGQNLTVYINCIVNSLQLRCAYFHLWPAAEGPPLPFRRVTSMMTYGDDVKGSVAKGYDWFNHISYAQFLQERDMVFTMPDKTSDPTPYMLDNDADFLKRHNHYNPDTGLIHGSLDETSIFKSLHTVLESKVVSLEDQSSSNIDGALREWWQHGKEVYELRRTQMKKVADRCKLTDFCDMLDESYEDRLEHFKVRYMQPDVEVVAEEEYVTSVGDEWVSAGE